MRKAINALIIRDKRLLLFRKKKNWILPGGKLEGGESDIEALVREFKEEASGAEIEVGEYYKTFIGLTPHKKDSLEAVTYFVKLKKPLSKLIPSGEIDEIGFFGYIDAPFPYLSDITKKIITDLNSEEHL